MVKQKRFKADRGRGLAMMSALLTAVSKLVLFDPFPISNPGWHRKALWCFKL